jgi:hypothetical protein
MTVERISWSITTELNPGHPIHSPTTYWANWTIANFGQRTATFWTGVHPKDPPKKLAVLEFPFIHGKLVTLVKIRIYFLYN